MSEFRQMRRKRQQLSEEESIGILQKATAGTLVLLGDNGYPYAVPISYVYNNGNLYFHSALSGHTKFSFYLWPQIHFQNFFLSDLHFSKINPIFAPI